MYNRTNKSNSNMLNKKLYLGILLTIALASCKNEDVVDYNTLSKLEVKVESAVSSRVGFDKNDDWSFYWHKGDQIWVNENVMSTEDADKSKTATFTGYGVDTNTGYAVYPYDMADENVEGTQLTWDFPTTYEYKDIDSDFFESSQDIPMYAKIENGSATFKHLGAIAAFKLNDWDFTGNHVFTLTTSKKITGTFTVDLANNPMFVTETEQEDVVTISFNRPANTGKSTIVFYVPIPTGTYDIKAKVKVEDVTRLSKSYENFTVGCGGIVYAEYGESTLVGGDDSNKTVSSIGNITDDVLATEKKDLTVKVTGEVTGTDNTITIPDDLQTETTTFSFTNIAPDATIKITEETANSYDGQIIIEVPEGTATSQIEAYVPNGEVYIKQGSVTTLIASSKSNTTIIGAGVIVGTLTVKQGNVRIEDGGQVATIQRSQDNADEVTYVYFESEVPAESNSDAKIIYFKVNAVDGAISVTNSETLAVAAKIEGATVKVKKGDYTFPTSVAAGVTIDCEEGTRFIGKSNFSINGATVKGAGFWNDKDRVNAGYGSVINARFENCSFTGAMGIYEAWAGETCEFIDCHFCAPSYACNFSGDSPANPVTFTRCSFMGWSSFGIGVTFDGCVFDSEPGGTYNLVRVYGDTNFNGCEFVYGKLSKNEAVCVDAIKSDKKVIFTNCKVTNASEDDYIFNYLANGKAGKTFVVDGGTYVYMGSKIVKNEAGEYLVHSASALKAIVKKINEGTDYFGGKTIKLGADIDLKNEEWTPIGSAAKDHGFMGNFDGNGHAVKNLKITQITLDSDGYAYAGLFGVTEGIDADNQIYIKNLTIENVTISTEGHIVAAAIAYPYYTTIENITVKGNVNIKGGDYTAGVLSYTRRCVDAKNITVEGSEGSSITGAITVGGVISDIQMNGGLTANYSNFKASGLTITATKNVGGISGIISGQTLDGATVKDVTIVCEDNRKGIVVGSLGKTSTIKNVSVTSVTGADNVVGATFEEGTAVTADGDVYKKAE